MSNSNYRPSTRSSSSAPSEVLPAPRPLPRQTPATPSGPKATRDSHPKRGGVSFVELSGHQVIAGKESTSYGSQTAVIPLAMKKIQNTDLESALQDIVGQEVPLSKSTPFESILDPHDPNMHRSHCPSPWPDTAPQACQDQNFICRLRCGRPSQGSKYSDPKPSDPKREQFGKFRPG